MSIVRPFKGLRPKKEFAELVAAPPYDVLNSEEARELAKGNPYTFLHVNKPEIDLDPSINLYDEQVYKKGSENLKKFIEDGIVVQDNKPMFYIYRLIMGNHTQTGLVACASIDEYEQDIIKKHELTRPDKEDDRVNHILCQNAQVGPVFLTYKSDNQINKIISEICKKTPEYDFTIKDGIQHTLWHLDDNSIMEQIKQLFKKIECLYVADGHHRSAAAQRVREIRKKENKNHTGEEEYNYFLTVLFPDDQMQILDYNRVVKDLKGFTKESFLEMIKKNFQISSTGKKAHKPKKPKEFGMYLIDEWFKLEAKSHTFNENDPIKRLDISILQDNLLSPLLAIGDPRKDKRIDFIGGIRGLKELEKLVNSKKFEVAFALFPTSIEDLIIVADAGRTMPPKSTWFEPKLRSGLVVHLLE
jgi:uncharacterized protein (DUF1015 family)